MKFVEKIQEQLARAQRNLIFFFDDEGRYLEELSGVEDAGIEVVQVQQNYFQLKYQLEFELVKEKVLIYHPYARPKGKELEKYPLLDLLVGNTELRVDPVSEFMAEYGINPLEHQTLVTQYRKQLLKKTAQRKLAKILDASNFTKANLQLGLISLALDFNTVTDRGFNIAKWLTAATDKKQFAKVNKRLEEQNLEEELIKWIENLTGLKNERLSLEFAAEVAAKIKYNVLTGYLEKPSAEDTYTKLKLERTADINRLLAFFKDWETHPELNSKIESVFEELAPVIQPEKILNWYGIDAEYGYYSDKSITEILHQLFDNLEGDPQQVTDSAIKWKKNDRLPEQTTAQFQFIYHAAEVYLNLQPYGHFRFNTPEDYIREYTQELYKIDKHYREALLAYETIRNYQYELEGIAEEQFSNLNTTYDNFLKTLNVEWQKLLEEKKFDFHSIDFPKQFNFYKDNLHDFPHKMVVIISDAFRYELATDLYDELIANSKNNVQLDAMLASVPSYTNLGMSNLLPNQQLVAEEGTKDISYKINGISTQSGKREVILQEMNPDNKTLKFTDMKKMKREEKRDFFRKSKITYLYHDWVDAIGDSGGTEHATFEATRQAHRELEGMIRDLSGDMKISNITVTADHGFIFNYKQLQETAREDFPEAEKVYKDHSRFVIADSFPGKVDGYSFLLRNTTNIDTELQVAIPRAINRYKKSGNIGLQFVHGGASLQEVIVPVLRFNKQWEKVQKSVGFKRIDGNTKIASGSLKVTLLQNEPVSNELRDAELVLGLYSETGDLFSNEVQLHLNATSTNPKERIFEEILSLNSEGSKASFCYLKAFAKVDVNRLNPVELNDLIKITTYTEIDDF